MNNLFTAIETKISGSILFNDVGGRIWLDKVPDNEQPVTFPYVLYFIVSGVPDDVFAKKGRNILIQFSIFSVDRGKTEITTIYNDLHTLFDDCSLTITSNTLIWMHETNVTPMQDDTIISNGILGGTHWAVDFEINVQAS